MKPGLKPNAQIKAKTKDRIARWVSFLALVALLAMATLPIKSRQHEIASDNTRHGSETWHG
jgi:hypothetical protein